MTTYLLTEADLRAFVKDILRTRPVMAPVARKNAFVYAEIASPEEIRLDHDITILPPKKYFFPPRQPLVTFTRDGFRNAVNPRPMVLFGVHPYDIKAIAMLDLLFTRGHRDDAYMANREAAVIIGANVQKHHRNAFFGTQANNTPLSGHDAFLTRIKEGYLLEILTENGKKLAGTPSWPAATPAQINAAAAVNEKAEKDCPEKLHDKADAISVKVRKSFPYMVIWKEMAEKCFSCSSCNTVCPTCYCFDVQDEWGPDQVSGVRYRRWDGCLALEFAKVSVQGGSENFREKKAERFRHRIMRKTSYLNDALGGPACVGCGRCSHACPADIANPVRVINHIMEE